MRKITSKRRREIIEKIRYHQRRNKIACADFKAGCKAIKHWAKELREMDDDNS